MSPSLSVVKQPGPEELLIQSFLRVLFPCESVDIHDDGSAPGMFDIKVGDPLVAAVEVGRVTEPATLQAEAHWRKHLEGTDEDRLRYLWLLSFGDNLAQEGRSAYPRVSLPDPSELVEILQRLEVKGLTSIPRLDRFVRPMTGGWTWSDEDIGALVNLIGDCTPIVAIEAPGRGGWRFGFAHGGSSTLDIDVIARHAATHVRELDDLRSKLERSGAPERIAALAYDSMSDMGWATSHWHTGQLPTEPPDLPDEVTSLLLVGMNGLAVAWRPGEGWRHLAEPSSVDRSAD